MAQFNSSEKVNDSKETVDSIQLGNMSVESTDVMTGDSNQRRFLYYQLKMSMMKAKRIDIIVSFLMESGVRMLLKDLKAALDRGAQIDIVCT